MWPKEEGHRLVVRPQHHLRQRDQARNAHYTSAAFNGQGLQVPCSPVEYRAWRDDGDHLVSLRLTAANQASNTMDGSDGEPAPDELCKVIRARDALAQGSTAENSGNLLDCRMRRPIRGMHRDPLVAGPGLALQYGFHPRSHAS